MIPNSTIVASGQLSVGDLYRYSLATLWRRFWFFLIITAVAGAYAPYSMLWSKQNWTWSPNLLLGLAFPFVLTPYAFFIGPYLGSRKLLRTNPNLQGVIQYVFSEAGIDASGPHSHGHLDWSAISEVRESASQFLLYLHRSFAHVVPKRFIASHNEVSALRRLLKQHVTKTSVKA